MGGILQQVDGKLVWVVPNCDWQLRCVSISRGAVTGDDTVTTVGEGHRWWKVMTASPMLPLAERVIPNSNAAAPGVHIGNRNVIGGVDVRPIAEKSPQGIPEPSVVMSNKLGAAREDSSKTITPSYTGGINSPRRSSASSTASRRPSRSLPSSRRDSSSAGIPEVVTESLLLPSEPGLGGRFVNRSNIDWTRGAMPRKNIQDMAGVEEHLDFLRNVPW